MAERFEVNVFFIDNSSAVFTIFSERDAKKFVDVMDGVADYSITKVEMDDLFVDTPSSVE